MAEQATDDLILSFDPFEGDFGAPGDKVFTNRMAIARKPGPCSHCDMEIAKGERVRRQTSKFDGELMTHRWLREQDWNDSSMCAVMQPKKAVKLGYDCPSRSRLDEAIDAASAAQGGA